MSEIRTMSLEAARSIGMPYRDDITPFTDSPPKLRNRVVASLLDCGACLSIYAPDSSQSLAEAVLSEKQCLALVRRLLCVMSDMKS